MRLYLPLLTLSPPGERVALITRESDLQVPKRSDSMNTQRTCVRILFAVFFLAGLLLIVPGTVMAHCDTMDGPVVMTAKTALEKGDVTPVLKWVRKDDEAEIRELFKKTLIVRSKGKEAKELAERYFFETLVRNHPAGEGPP